MIPYKSRKYRSTLDLSFELKVAGWDLPSVNKATKETSPAEALEHMGTGMPCIIEVLATTPLSEESIHFSKLDIKDGFWRMVCAVGEEWNFTYVLPNHPEAPTELVVPSALQMVWTLSPCFFHMASETTFDVAESYAHERVGTLPDHPFEGSTILELLGLENDSMWGTNKCNKFLTLLEEKPFWTMLEVFCDNFIHMAQRSYPAQLLHLSRALLHGIHSVFPPPKVSGNNGQDTISKKKLDSGKG